VRIITGTGRCGSSMMAALARACGADFGPESDLIPADEFNPEGYLEHRPTVYLNTILQLGEHLRPAELFENLAIARGRRITNRLTKIRYLLPSRPHVVRERAWRHRLEIGTIARDFAGHVVKDPRFCSTLHAWAEHGSVAGVLYCYRHPAEVARSQAHAYRLPLLAGYWLWLVRVREFLRNAQGLPVTFVEYGRLLDPSTATEEARRVLAFLGRQAMDTEIEAMLTAHVRRAHRRFSAQRDEVPRVVASLYDLLGRYHGLHDRPMILRPSANPPGEPVSVACHFDR
jgi:hypothetical protein